MTNALKAKRNALARKLDEMATPPPVVAKAAATVNAALAEWRAETAQLRAEMEALDAQLGVSDPVDPNIGANARAQRAAAAREREAQREANLRAILNLEAVRLAAWRDLQAATEVQREAVARILEANERMCELWHSLTMMRGVPAALDPFRLGERLGGRIASVLGTVKRGNLGPLRLPTAERWRHPDWAGAEEQAMGRQLVDLHKPKGNQHT